MTAALRSLIVWLAVAAPLTVEAGAQQRLPVARSVTPDTVTVGDPFTSLLRVGASSGDVLEFHGLEAGDSVQPVDTVRVVARDDSSVVVAYRLVAWVAETPFSARARVRVASPSGSAAEYEVPLATPTVASVLPAGIADLRPRPSRGVIRFEYRPWWPDLLAGAGVAAALALGLWLWRRRRKRPQQSADPRSAALAALEGLRASTEIDPAERHAEATRVLRGYLAELDPGWGREWTTTEIVPLVRSGGRYAVEAVSLERVLAAADRVKFAGYRPTAAEADGFIADVARWVDGFRLREPEAVTREAA